MSSLDHPRWPARDGTLSGLIRLLSSANRCLSSIILLPDSQSYDHASQVSDTNLDPGITAKRNAPSDYEGPLAEWLPSVNASSPLKPSADFKPPMNQSNLPLDSSQHTDLQLDKARVEGDRKDEALTERVSMLHPFMCSI